MHVHACNNSSSPLTICPVVLMKCDGRTRVWFAAFAGVIAAGMIPIANTYWPFFVRFDTIQEIREVPIHTKVRLLGVVTHIDEPAHRFWLEDRTGGVPFDASPTDAQVHVGETVAVEAIKTAPYDKELGPTSMQMREVAVHSSPWRVRLPRPASVTLTDFPISEHGVPIRLTAVVRGARRLSGGHVELFISDSQPVIQAVIAQPTGEDLKLANAKVQMTGIPEEVRDTRGGLVKFRLWVASAADVKIVQPTPARAPLYSIRTLYLSAAAKDGHRIRIRGRISEVASHSILLEDRWGAIACQFDQPVSLKDGTPVEVEGFPEFDTLRTDLFHAQVRAIPVTAIEESGDVVSNPPITTVHAIRNLPPALAAQALPVRLTGVVTYVDSIWHYLYLQDPTGAIFVKYAGDPPRLLHGERVQLTGISNPGDFAPVIVSPSFRMEGQAHMPVAVPVTPDAAAAGIRDSQYVTIEGIVHPMSVGAEARHPMLTFELFTAFGQVHVYTSPLFPSYRHIRYLEDAKVRMRGVFGTVFNSRRQLVGYQFLVQSPSDIDVVEPAVPNPFAMHSTPIENLLRFSPNARFGHRVKVEGTVTMVAPDFLYLQDAGGGVEIRGDTRDIHVGEVVDAVGYPTLAGRYSPIMADAAFRPTGRSSFVTPRIATGESLLRGQDDSMLVTVQGRLVTILNGPAGRSFVLQSGVRTFTAQLDTLDQGIDMRQIREGSVLRLTGVCLTLVDSNKLYTLLEQNPSSFEILMRSPRDLTIAQAAPFWTLQKVFVLLALVSLAVLATLIWVTRLRRRVRVQALALRKASETAQAIHDLSDAMQNVSRDQRFDQPVSVRGSEEIAQLVVGFNRMLSDLKQRDDAMREAEAKLQHMALNDPLTGLPNRRLLTDRLRQSLARARRENYKMAMLYIDLDGFKLVNDSLGHDFGDKLLAEVARRLQSRIRESDTLARIGGDEFTIVLGHIGGIQDADQVAHFLLNGLEAPFTIEGHDIRISASIGISLFPEHGNTEDQLLQQADCAMYAAKRGGKNRIVRFSDNLGTTTRERMTLENALPYALANGQIAVHYQPQFDLTTGTLVRFEALARWTHPTLGSIPPVRFIPIAEETGTIVPLGAFILERACTEAVKWQRVFGRDIQVAVNVSRIQFARESFVEEIEQTLHRTGLKPSLLQIELSESAMLTGIDRSAESIKRLRSIGVAIAIDDFGTGYSCLSYLPLLAFSAMKIDRSYVHELTRRPQSKALVRSILTMAHNLNMRVVVEGIETQEQLHLIQSLGADEAQGDLLGKPSADPVHTMRWPLETTAQRSAVDHVAEVSIEAAD